LNRNARTFAACAGSSIRRLSEWPRLLPRCASVRHRRAARHFSNLTASRAWSRRFVKCWGVGGVGNTFKYFSQMPKLFSSAGCTARAASGRGLLAGAGEGAEGARGGGAGTGSSGASAATAAGGRATAPRCRSSRPTMRRSRGRGPQHPRHVGSNKTKQHSPAHLQF